MRHLLSDVNPGIAILSFLAAVAAAFVALEIAARALRTAGRPRRRLLGLSGLIMGGGIWAMHFLAMVGLQDSDLTYRLDLVLLSVLFAVAGATVALTLVAQARVTRGRVFLAASFMGLAVSAMHYTGMAAVESDASFTWDIPLVLVSMVIAYAASLLALGSVASMQGERTEWSARGRLAAATSLGVAVAGLHYTGMAAVTFRTASPAAVEQGGTLAGTTLATALGVAAFVLLLVVTLDGSRQKRRAEMAGDLAVFARVAREIGRRGDARATIVSAAHELIGCDIALLLEPDDLGGLAVGGPSATTAAFRVDAEASLAGGVLRSGERRFVQDLRGAPFADPTAMAASGAVSALFEPVLLDDRPVAVLVSGWTRRVQDPGERRLAISALLAAESAVAIERADLVARLREQALVDGLTGLPNRRALDQALEAEVKRAGRSGQPLTVAMVDVDRFKAYNDAHGHPAGDRLLSEIASAWRAELRGDDVIGRFGGEEFLMLLPGVDGPVATTVIERLRAATPDEVTCSFGLATWDGDEGGGSLVVRADAALYAAKAGGRDRVVVG